MPKGASVYWISLGHELAQVNKHSRALVWAVLWLVFLVAQSHAEVLEPEEKRQYFTHSISEPGSQSTLSSQSTCGGCLEEMGVLAKASEGKPTLRRVSDAPDKDPPKIKLNGDYFLGIFSDTKHILLSPLNWEASDWITASLVLGTAGVFFALDNDIREFVQDNRSGGTDDTSAVFEPFGNGAYTAPAMAAYYLYGRIFKNEKAERVALLSAESFAITGLFTFALKYTSGRSRPGVGVNSGDWNGPDFEEISFPSAHTSTAFAIATVFATEYENNPFIPPIAYGIATLTGLSRLNDDEHWASDVFLGGALGYFVAKTVLKLHSDKKGRHYTIYPKVSKKETGLQFVYRF